jgi:hypothetical protein
MRARLLLVPAAIMLLGGCGYNRIQALDERTEELKSNIGVELTNRNQLIPNIVATVQGAADFERGTFTDVARARSGMGAGPAAGGRRRSARRRGADVGRGCRAHAPDRDVPEHRGRALPRASGDPELRDAAGPARGEREPDLRRTARLQRIRPRVQHVCTAVSTGDDRSHYRARVARSRSSRRRRRAAPRRRVRTPVTAASNHPPRRRQPPPSTVTMT